MMRAMPYWSVSPNAISAYIPPSTSPERTMSSARVMRIAATYSAQPPLSRGVSGDNKLLPRWLGDNRFGTLLRDWRYTEEVCALPLANSPDILVEAVLQFHLADDGVKAAGINLLDDGRAVEFADALDRLLQHLQARIGDRARPTIGLTSDHFLVVLDVPLDPRKRGIGAANAHDALRTRGEFALVHREGSADTDEKDLGIETEHFGGVGDCEGVRRVAEGKKHVGVRRLRVLEHRLHVLRAKRIGLVVDQIEAGLFQPCARRRRQLDTELIANRNHRDLFVDLAVLLELGKGFDDTVDDLRRQTEPEGQVGPALRQLRRLVSVGCNGKLRIAELIEDRRGGEIHAGAPGRQDEINLVLRCQPLDCLDHFFRIAAVVIFDHFNL